jgi:hypothetical protein
MFSISQSATRRSVLAPAQPPQTLSASSPVEIRAAFRLLRQSL